MKKAKLVALLLILALTFNLSVFAVDYKDDPWSQFPLSALPHSSEVININESVSSCEDFINCNHTWSVGWCGRTCRLCGIIELFHAPDGCPRC